MLLTISWMIVIFLFSSHTAEKSGELSNTIVTEFIVSHYPGLYNMSYERQQMFVETLDIIVRKGAHITEYFVLCLLNCIWLFGYGIAEKFGRAKYLLISLFISVMYSISDEIHQRFVPGRSGNMFDVMIDSIGIVVAIIVVSIVLKICDKKIKE